MHVYNIYGQSKVGWQGKRMMSLPYQPKILNRVSTKKVIPEFCYHVTAYTKNSLCNNHHWLVKQVIKLAWPQL